MIGRPSILVPLPHALDNDQLRNAAFLQNAGGAICLEQKDLDAAALAQNIAHLASDPAILQNAARAAMGVGKPDAVQRLADLVEQVANGDRSNRNRLSSRRRTGSITTRVGILS